MSLLPFTLSSALLLSVVSPDLHPDRSVTFRLSESSAQTAAVRLEGQGNNLKMSRSPDGDWEATSAPLAPDYYGYVFLVDGKVRLDPSNPSSEPNLIQRQSLLHVTGAAAQIWDAQAVPHGKLQRQRYHSQVEGDERDYYVYTPPGYDPAGAQRYPVLYLLHGFSDDASAWTQVGMANVILDNLISTHKAKRMIVVMPLGYGTPEIIDWSRSHGALPDLGGQNVVRFRQGLMSEVIPEVDRQYRTETSRIGRAIGGLSMGGMEALLVGLNELDRFAWIGSFSAGGLPVQFADAFPMLAASDNARIKLLWLTCGSADRRFLPDNRNLMRWFSDRGIVHDESITVGGHEWQVWRRNLAQFLPLLFN